MCVNSFIFHGTTYTYIQGLLILGLYIVLIKSFAKQTYICMRVYISLYVLIVVVAHKSTFQVVNIDTIFWLEDRSPLGKVRKHEYT